MKKRVHFFKPAFFCYLFDESGIFLIPEPKKTIVEVPRHKYITKLQSYLGLPNYYGKYLHNLSSLLHLPHRLLNNGIKWGWDTKFEEALKKSKNCFFKTMCKCLLI